MYVDLILDIFISKDVHNQLPVFVFSFQFSSSLSHNAYIVKSRQTREAQEVGTKTNQAKPKGAESEEGNYTLLLHFRSQTPPATTTSEGTNHQIQFINQINHEINQVNFENQHNANKKTTRHPRRRQRRGAAGKNTSKFTGRVVGTSNNDKLSDTVKTLIDNLYRDVWLLQENVTQSAKEVISKTLVYYDFFFM